MELDEVFKDLPLEKKQIVYPAYQTTNRFHNLYTDVRTWARELIQNADDADATKIEFEIDLPKKIHVRNNGHPFDENDVTRLLTPCLGGKEFDKTGAMNLGALSVLSVADDVFYHSGNIALKFEMNHKQEDFVPYINRGYKNHFKGTQVFLPLHDRLSSDDLKKLEHIDTYLTKYSHLLFTKHLNTIVLRYPKRTIRITKKIEKEHKYRHKFTKIKIQKILIQQNIKKERIFGSAKENNQKSTWLVATSSFTISKHYFTEKELKSIKGKPEIPLYIAFRMEEGILRRVNFPIYIIFPSETDLGLGFVVSSNFRPETSRKGFCTEGIDGEFNIELLKEISKLTNIMLLYFKEKINSLSTTDGKKLFNSLLETFFYRETYTSLEPYIKKYIFENISTFLKNNLYAEQEEWDNASKFAIADEHLNDLFKNQYHILKEPIDEHVKKLLKNIGVHELSINDVVETLVQGKVQKIEYYRSLWLYIVNNRMKLSRKDKKALLTNPTLPNRLGRLKNPQQLYIPHKEAIELYNPNRQVHDEFVTHELLKSFLKRLGVKKLKPKQVFEYFITRKSIISSKKLGLIENYYSYFYKHNLKEYKRRIVITTKGFRNPEECFFERENIKETLGENIPFIPSELENSKICNSYLKNLGVSEDLTAPYVIRYIKQYGTSVITLDLLRFLSKHLTSLPTDDLQKLEEMNLIPVEGTFVKPSECYLLTKKNKKIFGDLVYYFDPQDEENKEWVSFFKRIGLKIEPTIKDLKEALNDCIQEEFKYLKHGNNQDQSVRTLLERIELILKTIYENKDKQAKLNVIEELRTKQFIPTTKGIKKPYEIYLSNPEIKELLQNYGAYSLIKIPHKLGLKLGINKEASPEDVAHYLLDELITQKPSSKSIEKRKSFPKQLDTIYSYLGRQENYSKLTMGTHKKLATREIIYLPQQDKFEKPSKLILYSKEAKKIFGTNANLIKYSHYPNSLNFFKKVGVKTSISTNEIAQYLLDYIGGREIAIEELFSLYNIVGQRFEFLDRKLMSKLKNTRVVLSKTMDSFEYPSEVFIDDEKLYVEKFPSIKIAAMNKKILVFLEKLEVKKISEIIESHIKFGGEPSSSEYTKSIEQILKTLIPFLNIIQHQSDVSFDRGWQRRIKTITCREYEFIYQELRYKKNIAKVEGEYIGYDINKNLIGLKKGITRQESLEFYMMLSKAVARILFQHTPEQIKLICPLIEKILYSENKVSTLKNLGFSTLKLEAQEYNTRDLKLKIDDHIKERGSKNVNTTTKREEPESEYTKIEKVPYKKPSRGYSKKKKLKVIYEKSPSKNQIIDYVQQFHKEFTNGKRITSKSLRSKLNSTLMDVSKKSFKNIESEGYVDYGGLDYTPSIPKLECINTNGFSYYKQMGLKNSYNLKEIKIFSEIMQYIVESMEGNPETVSIAYFNAPVNAMNYEGQLLFNWYTMSKDTLSLPLHLQWIFTAAHELAHYFIGRHNQLHSKYMMIFAIRAIMKLPAITQKYKSLYEG